MGITNYPVEPKADRGEPGWSYDSESDTLVVSAEYDGPLQFWVCVASALASSYTWTHVLTPERLEDGEIGAFLSDHKELLWGSRCLGHLSRDIETGEEYAAALQDARDDLLDLTRKLKHEEYEDRNRFRGTITREALGLAGTTLERSMPDSRA